MSLNRHSKKKKKFGIVVVNFEGEVHKKLLMAEAVDDQFQKRRPSEFIRNLFGHHTTREW